MDTGAGAPCGRGVEMRIRAFSGLWLLLGLLAFLWPAGAHAATIQAASCNQPDVNAAVTGAVDGDTVQIPACSTTIWTVGIRFCKSLTIQGAGASLTSIAVNAGGGFWAVGNGCVGKTVRFTGMTVTNVLVGSFGLMNLAKCFGCTFRIDHNVFVGNISLSVPYRVAWIGGTATGVMDHNTITNMGVMVENQASGEADLSAGTASWKQPPSFGTANAFYFEDNTWNFPNHGADMDCINGGRVVWRYNTFVGPNGAYSQTSPTGPFNHGYDSIPRSCRELDVHDNVITGGGYLGIQFRGGSGLVYNNLCAGRWDQGFCFGITNYRDVSGSIGQAGNKYGNYCDGSQSVDGNTQPTATYAGWPCRDQIGRGTDVGIPGAQSAVPLYTWNNCITALGCTPGGADAVDPHPYPSYGGTNYTPIHIVKDRDYYTPVASFDGSSGVGSGPLAVRPATCSVNPDTGKGPAYWATDTNTLYQCSAINTWTTYYKPFTYPHPLVGPPAVQPPTNLSVVVS